MPEHFRLLIGAQGLEGDLCSVESARGLVVFAHGSGSSRNSRPNLLVAETLQRQGLGTLLFDLLTPDEADDRANVFDIQLLARRVPRPCPRSPGAGFLLRVVARVGPRNLPSGARTLMRLNASTRCLPTIDTSG